MTVGGVGSESWRYWGRVPQRTVPLILCVPHPHPRVRPPTGGTIVTSSITPSPTSSTRTPM